MWVAVFIGSLASWLAVWLLVVVISVRTWVGGLCVFFTLFCLHDTCSCAVLFKLP